MNCRAIDYESWPRREMYEFFSAADQPFYNVAFRLDAGISRFWPESVQFCI